MSVPSPSAVGGVAGPVTQSGLRAGSASEGPAAGSPPTAGGRRGARCPRASAQPAARAVNPSLCARGGTHTPTLACGYAHTHTHTRPHAQMPSYAQTRGPAPRTHRPRRPSHARAHPAARPGTREGATPTLPRHTGAALSIAHTPARVRGSAQTRTCTRTAGPESARHARGPAPRGPSLAFSVRLACAALRRWLCLEDSRPSRRREGGLWACGRREPEFAIDFCLSLASGRAHQRGGGGRSVGGPGRGARGPGSERERSSVQTRGCETGRRSSGQNPALPGSGGEGAVHTAGRRPLDVNSCPRQRGSRGAASRSQASHCPVWPAVRLPSPGSAGSFLRAALPLH